MPRRDPAKQNKSRAVMLRLTPDQYEALAQRAAREDRSVASVIRIALTAHLEGWEPF